MCLPQCFSCIRWILVFAMSLALVLLLALPPFATAEEHPATAVIVDASGSMLAEDAGGQTRMNAAKQAVVELFSELPVEQQVALLTYGTETGSSDEEKELGCQDVRTLVPLGGNRTEIIDQVKSLYPRGYTPIGASLLQAENELPKEGPRQIVLVSDGIDTCAPPPVCEVAKEIQQRGIDIVINVIGLNVDEQARRELQCIAQEGGGSYADAQDAASLKEQLVLKTMRTLQKYQPGGVLVQGASDIADAPLLEVGGLNNGVPDPTHYQDVVAAEQTLHYKVKVAEREQIIASFITVPPDTAGGEVGHFARQEVEFIDAHGTKCVQEYKVNPAANEFKSPLTSFVVSKPAGESCAPGELYLRMMRKGSLAAEKELPTEFTLWKMPQLEVAETKIETTDTAPNLELGETQGRLSAAFGPSQAQVVQPGAYDVEIVPGEMQWFKVPVQEGQRLQLLFDAPPFEVENPEVAFTEIRRTLDWVVLNPVYTPVNLETFEGSERFSTIHKLTLSDMESRRGYSVSAPLNWGNTKNNSYSRGFLSGEQIVGIRYNTHFRNADEQTKSLPVKFKLGIETIGEPRVQPTLSYQETLGEGTSKSTVTETTEERGLGVLAALVLGALGVIIVAILLFGILRIVQGKR